MSNLHRTKRFILIISGLSVFLPILSFADQFKCVHVYDGDTINVGNHKTEMTIRLVGIDAPELPLKKNLIGQPFCMKAKEHLANLVLNKMVDIKFYGKDRYGISLGEVFVDGVNVNLKMIGAGLAEVYRGKPASGLAITTYRDAESKAKESVLGIWILRDQYFSPRDWREVYR